MGLESRTSPTRSKLEFMILLRSNLRGILVDKVPAPMKAHTALDNSHRRIEELLEISLSDLLSVFNCSVAKLQCYGTFGSLHVSVVIRNAGCRIRQKRSGCLPSVQRNTYSLSEPSLSPLKSTETHVCDGNNLEHSELSPPPSWAARPPPRRLQSSSWDHEIELKKTISAADHEKPRFDSGIV